MFGNNKKLLTSMVSYSSLVLYALVNPSVAVAEPTSAAINLAAISEPVANINQSAQTLLAISNQYQTGKGVQANPLRAFEYCKRAAQKGLAEAQYQLAAMYLESDVISQSEDEALKWLERAVEQDHTKARFTYNYLLNNTHYDGC